MIVQDILWSSRWIFTKYVWMYHLDKSKGWPTMILLSRPEKELEFNFFFFFWRISFILNSSVTSSSIFSKVLSAKDRFVEKKKRKMKKKNENDFLRPIICEQHKKSNLFRKDWIAFTTLWRPQPFVLCSNALCVK